MITRALSHRLILGVAFGAAASAPGTGMSAHVPLQPPGTIQVSVDLTVGGTAYSGRGPGECNHAADASIHEAPAQMWSVRRHDADRDVNFTLWRLKNGDMFTLFVAVGGKSHRVNTLLVGPPADRRGSGTAAIAQRGKGGQFTINAISDTGLKITGTLTCSGFTHPEANG
jgi:hypothetical protein